ncbi:MAG: hypothetical protein V1704_03240 [Candidatus Vogelbacteria bacterium]
MLLTDKSDKSVDKHGHSRIKLCVSGAAETDHCGEGTLELAMALGREIVEQGAVLVTGATTGFPLWAAKGAKDAGGTSLGLSPASTEHEHINFYKLPLDYLDLVIYTGFGYSGRNLLLTRASDAVLIGCGRVGTINEFTIAFEDRKPIGILDGCGPTAQIIREIMEKGHRHNDNIIFDTDPKTLVARVIEMVKKEKAN